MRVERDIAESLLDLLGGQRFGPEVGTRGGILAVGKFEADEDLGVTLSPLQHRTGLERLLVRHADFLQQPLVELQAVADHADYAVAVVLFGVVELPEAVQWLGDELELVGYAWGAAVGDD
jgi:hypothetical protein